MKNSNTHLLLCNSNLLCQPSKERLILKQHQSRQPKPQSHASRRGSGAFDQSIHCALITSACTAGIWLGFIAPDEGRDISWAIVAVIAASFIITIACLLTTSFMDPGFIPRQHVGEVQAASAEDEE